MKYKIKTLGCKTNWCDSCAMGDELRAAGWERAGAGETAHAVIINTCAVTGEAERKSRQAVRRAIKENHSARVIACGCAVQRSQGEYAAMPGLYAHAGTAGRIVTARAAAGLAQGGVQALPGFFEENAATGQQGHTRAYLKVQEGCDNFCAYCVIPHVRGIPRSRGLDAIAAQRDALVDAGYSEIVLTGINLSKYGRDLNTGVTLADALGAAYAPGVRLRLGSLEPEGIGPQLFDRVAQMGVELCPHFHVSLQSGAERTLLGMNRRYTPGEYAARLAVARQYYPNAAITTDVIVGFPGESEEDFDQSLTFVQSMGFAKVHVFPYSKRPGTQAARMGREVSPGDIKRRAAAMGAVAARAEEAFYLGLVGQTRRVLFETPLRGREGYMQGHGEDYSHIAAPLRGGRGKFYNVRVKQSCGGYALGEVENG